MLQSMFGTSCLAALALALLPGGAVAIDGSALQKGRNGAWHLVLPSELLQSMSETVPYFTIAADSEYADSLRARYPYGEHASPFALIRDLNGDAREDLVVDGREGDDRMTYLALSKGHRFRWLPLIRVAGAAGAVREDALEWSRGESGGESWFALVQRRPGSVTSRKFHWSKGDSLQHVIENACGIVDRPSR